MIKVTEEHLEFLDNLRDSGEVNMFGASTYVEDEFNSDDAKHIVNSDDAKHIVTTWMETFAERHPR